MQPPQTCAPADVSTHWLLGSGGRPAFVFAHQDDETVLAGMVQRVLAAGAEPSFVWWTNGDGLAERAGKSLAEYARTRIAETDRSLELLGVPSGCKTDLETSEVENYRQLVRLAESGERRTHAIDYFMGEAAKIEDAIRKANPDRVFVLAYQGGHFEHDLTHAMTARAVRALRAETGEPIPIVQCPAYEYVLACALRFKPWYRGDKRRITLTAEELARKRAAFEAYQSQRELLETFERILDVYGWLATARHLRRVTAEDVVSIEEASVMDPRFNYARSTHRLDRANYIGDHFEGTPIRFSTMVEPLVTELMTR